MEPLTRKEKKKTKHEKAAKSYVGPYTERGARAILTRQQLSKPVKPAKPV